MVLICADVIRPGLDWLLRFAPARRSLTTEMARTRDSKAFPGLTRPAPKHTWNCKPANRP